jgi:tricorn protease
MTWVRPCCLLFVCLSLSAQTNRGWYRFPTIHGDTIAFTAEGDLWEVGIQGGRARRLTTAPGQEVKAAFSPDGKTLAFVGDYEGPKEIYTISAAGGLPVRRTYEGGDERSIRSGPREPPPSVVGWTPDGKILYATYHFAGLPDAQLVTIDKDNRFERIPLSQAAQGAFDPETGVLFFTRLDRQPSFTKRYAGGTAENLWRYKPGSEAIPLTGDYSGTSKNPMWWKGRVFFLSDRNGTMNLWSMDENGKNLRRHTNSEGFDIKSASLSDGRIVYQLGADLRLYDIGSGDDRVINIELPSDFDNLREHWIKEPAQYLSAAHFSPDGNSVVLTARGRAFVAPLKDGRISEIAASRPGRFREARLMPGSKSVVLISTESGEAELWMYPANGTGSGQQLTKGGTVLRWDAIPSPDEKWIAHQDKDQNLWLYNLSSNSNKKIGTSINGDNDSPAFSDLSWSPDSKWLTFGENAANSFEQIMLYNVATGAKTPLTTNRYNSGSAAWSPDGQWLYFVSDRALSSTVKSPWGSRLPDPYFDRTNKIFALPLKRDLVSPFRPPDELHASDSKPPDASVAKSEKPKEASSAVPEISIDLEGIATRIEEVPAPPGNMSDLHVLDKRLCWINHDNADPAKDVLECVNVGNKGEKPEAILDGVKGYEVSNDRKKILVHKGNDLFALDASVAAPALKDPKTLTDGLIDLKRWNFYVTPTAEFREAYLDAWRLERDYFYDRKMHGVPWTMIRDKYLEFIGRVRDREELSDLISDMVGELSALHTFVHGGDLRSGPDQILIGFLGARIVKDQDAGGFRLEHIYRTDPDRPDKLSPLLRPGVKLAEGDVITAVNGHSLANSVDIGELLRDQAGKQVLLDYRTKGSAEVLQTVVTAISDYQDCDLRYAEWEYTRRTMVEKQSDSRLAYIHLRAMGPDDINRWEEEYTPTYNRQGLIIDVRHNRGGNIDSWLLGKLLRKAWMYWQPREGAPYWNMQGAFRGPVVVLCDQLTASDGEAFAEGFRRLGLGKLIGTRTWGGEIWLSASNVLADTGIATAAEMGVYGPEGKWLIEGHGVDPDIVVDNLPHASFAGEDAQLQAAVDLLEKLVKTSPNPVPPPPPYPDKYFKTAMPGRRAPDAAIQ